MLASPLKLLGGLAPPLPMPMTHTPTPIYFGQMENMGVYSCVEVVILLLEIRLSKAAVRIVLNLY